MPNNADLPLYYWDACVPLAYINGDVERLQHIDSFMERSGKDWRIVTSVLTITEVAFGASEQTSSTLDLGVEAQIASLWQAGSPIQLVEFYDLIALRAQRIMRDAVSRSWQLKPADAIHLATADQLGCVTAFHTYDKKLERFADLTETRFQILAPISRTPLLALTTAAPKADSSRKDRPDQH